MEILDLLVYLERLEEEVNEDPRVPLEDQVTWDLRVYLD